MAPKTLVLLIFLVLPRLCFAQYVFCVPVTNFDLNPIREIKDGKELIYLVTLFPSFITSEPKEEGIIEAYEFSPEGKLFKAKVNQKIKWSDGTSLNAKEVAETIVKALPYRPLGERVRIEDIKILNDSKFQIQFDSNIQNLKGTFIEALKTGSRHNRFWMHKKHKDQNIYVSKYQITSVTKNEVTILVGDKSVKLVNDNRCEKADFGLYPQLMSIPVGNYTYRESPIQVSLMAVFNTNLPKKRRLKLSALLKKSFIDSPSLELLNVDSFYLKGEPGYNRDKPWKNLKPQSMDESFSIFYEIPIFLEVVKASCPRCSLESINSAQAEKGDVQLIASSIFGGRHIVFQDLLKWGTMRKYLKKAPHTVSFLETIAKLSASTMPPDGKTLREFETASYSEVSIMPLARKTVRAYTKKGLPIQLTWNSGGELLFSDFLETEQ